MDKVDVVKKEDSDLPERRETLDLQEKLERRDPRYDSPRIVYHHFISLL